MKPIPEHIMWIFDLTTDPYANKHTHNLTSVGYFKVLDSRGQRLLKPPQIAQDICIFKKTIKI